MKKINLIADEEKRLDVFLSKKLELSRVFVQEIIINNQIIIDSKVVSKKNFILKEGMKIEGNYEEKEELLNAKAQNIDIKIVYEDENVIVVDKPTNMVVHPAPGNYENTLVNALLYKFNHLSNVNGALRPGIVHRLDKDTSGLMLVAKNDKMHNFLAQQLKDRKIKRKYKAIVEGKLEHQISHINLPIARDEKNRKKMAVSHFNSKEAITHVFVEKVFYYQKRIFSLIRCELETGRTHQIRVHLSYIKHPVFGDPVYGTKVDAFNQRLHAYEIEFTNLDGTLLKFNSKLPKEFDIANE
ncbi:RluA family pseudouridine synthase [Mycoplasma sp. 1654_15]|uniref:RluA family pseudouridine synthase n=1 Tax=Mycoplasma sp. 1654_15 TaxID=2725994 RepID=UPI002FE27786